MATQTEKRASELRAELVNLYRVEDGWTGLDVVPAGSASAVRVTGIFRGEATVFSLPTPRSNVTRLVEWASRSLDAHAEAAVPAHEIDEGVEDVEAGPLELKSRSISVEADRSRGRVVLSIPGPEASVLAVADMHPKDALALMDKIFKAARIAMRED